MSVPRCIRRRTDPDCLRFGPQDPREYAVKGAHPQVGRLRSPHDGGDPFLHLLRRFVGEGERQYPERIHALGEQLRNANSKHARLARSRACDHHIGSGGVQHGLALCFVESFQMIHVPCAERNTIAMPLDELLALGQIQTLEDGRFLAV